MFETYNTNGYDLYQPFENIDQWVIDDKSEAFHGTLKEVCQYMITKLDFQMEDIEEGLMLLADNISRNHNALHFGAFRSIIYTFKKEDKHGKQRAS
jgi:hypothetical protein